MARVDVFKVPPGGKGHTELTVSDYSVFPRTDNAETRFNIVRVDTSQIASNRRFMFLDDFNAKVILGPSDDHLDSAVPDRLTGRCLVMTHVACVRRPC